MRMFPIDCGTMKFPYSLIENDVGAPQAAAARLVSVPIEAFLIEHAEGLILFDTGCDPAGMSGSWPQDYRNIPFEQSYVTQRLEAMGIKPCDIDYVVASHLHFDHAGCLHLFKNARVFVSKNEFDKTLYAYENKLDLNAHLESDIKNWLDADLSWEKVPPCVKEQKILDGVTIINFGSGHSWGMLGLLVKLPVSGNHFLVSDAIYTKRNQGPPEILPGMLHDKEGWLKTVKFIASYASDRNAAVIYGHDFEQFRSLLGKANGCME